MNTAIILAGFAFMIFCIIRSLLMGMFMEHFIGIFFFIPLLTVMIVAMLNLQPSRWDV